MQMVELTTNSTENSIEIVQNLQKIQNNGFNTLPLYLLSVCSQDIFNSNGLKQEIEKKINEIFNADLSFSILPTGQSSNSYFESSFQSFYVRNKAELARKILSLLYETHLIEEIIGNETNNTKNLIIIPLSQASNRGIFFSRNPLNAFDEKIIEIVIERSNGEIDVEHGVFPNRKPLDPQTNELVSKYPWIKTLLEKAGKINRLFSEDVFLEWIYDGNRFFWVQIRPIEQMKHPVIYSNKIAKDMLPGLIKPLVWSVNTQINGGAWKRLIDKVIGNNNFELSKMTKRFYGRAYFNMGLFGDFFTLFGMPRETLELMMLGETHSRKTGMPRMKINGGILKFLPKIALLALRNIDVSKKVERFIQTQKVLIDSGPSKIEELDKAAILDEVKKLLALNENCALYVIVVRMIRSFHFSLLRSMLRLKGIECRIDINNDELRDVDPKYSLVELKKLLEQMPKEEKDALSIGKVPTKVTYLPFIRAYKCFMRRFGHMSDSTVDMSLVQWREDPSLVIKMIENIDLQEKDQEKNQVFPKGLFGLIFRQFLKTFKVFEMQSARLGYLYAYGYSKFRPHFLRIGDQFEANEALKKSEDIFFLDLEEVVQISENKCPNQDIIERVDERKIEMTSFKDLIVPEIIFGNQAAPIIKKGSICSRYTGLGASQGYFQGRIKVIKTLADVSKVTRGEALVIPFSDTSWTPILCKAGAIVSETGGLLSHCSIVAREFGIPAVVGVEGATKIPDGVQVRIDGYTGEILVIG